MRRTWNTCVSPTIGIVTIGTGKIGLGAACAAAGATSTMEAAAAAVAVASTSRRVGVVFSMSFLPFDFLGHLMGADTADNRYSVCQQRWTAARARPEGQSA